jgi:2',3'-cyclic-nucleotide 2'-phosphodiesterase (5'-nucleotidase family)
LVNVSNEIYGDKTVMQCAFVLNRLLRTTILTTALLLTAQVIFAQGTVIEPCKESPSPKPAVSSAATKVDEKASQTLIDSSIPDDPALVKLLAPYAEKVRALSAVIGTLDGSLTKTGVGAGTLGPFVTDAMLAEARRKSTKKIDMAITNAGGLRKNEIAAGQLRASDIFELLPFENALITLDLTGEQLKKILGTRDAQAGAQVEYRWNEQNRTEVLSTKVLDASGAVHDINPKGMYTIVTIDYLYKLNSGSYAVLQEGKNLTPLNVTIRDAVTDYIKAETAAGRHIKSQTDNRYVQIGPGPAKQETPPQ